MARPRTVSDEQIAEASRDIFLRHGASASADLVAQRLGVSSAALYKRMKTKKSLIVAGLCDQREPSFVATLRQGPRMDEEIAAQLTDVAAEALRTFRRVIPALFALRTAGIALDDAFGRGPPPHVVVRAELARFLSRAVKAGLLAPLAPDVVAEVFFGAIEARCLMEHLASTPGQAPRGSSTRASSSRADAKMCAELVSALVTKRPRAKAAKRGRKAA
jgi:AcrR family transcriptional regulator